MAIRKSNKALAVLISILVVIYLAGIVFLSKTLKPYKLELSTTKDSYEINVDQELEIPFSIHSLCSRTISKKAKDFVSYHLYDSNGNLIEYDNQRTPLKKSVFSFMTKEESVKVSPLPAGQYLINIDLIQEGTAWFGEKNTKVLPIRVTVSE